MASHTLDTYRCERCGHASPDAVCPRCGFPESLALPGMETADAERATAHGEAEAEQMTARLTAPLGSINRASDDLALFSPLFRGSDASPQAELFAPQDTASGNRTTESETEDLFR